MNVSSELIVALAFLYGAFFMIGFRRFSAFPLAIVAYVPVSSLASLAELTSSIDSIPVTIILSTLFLLVAVAIWKRRNFQGGFSIALGIVLTAALAFISQVITRAMGFSSIGFTDGHTILNRGQDLALGNLERESGSKALKRGFGLSAIQAQGPEGEYLAGFMPLVFLAALIASSLLIHRIYMNRTITIVATAVMAPMALGVEAISRHLFLINSHSYAWLFMAVLLGFTYVVVSSPLTAHQWFGIFTVFSAIGFMRFDYIVIFAIFGLIFILYSKHSNWILPGLAVPIAILSSASWLLLTTEDFPFFGDVGLTLYIGLGLAIPITLSYAIRKLNAGPELFAGNTYWFLVAILAVFLAFRVSWESSISSFFINAFLGEGLWGAFFYFLTAIVGLAIWSMLTSKIEPSLFARVFMITFLLYLMSKTFDNFEIAGNRSGVARVGFGDSLNRSLVTWLPFVYILVAKVQSRLQKAQ
jgi:hypothetical protein